MVHEHSIPFGAPSQLRLLIAPDPEGNADLAVLDQFDQPMGNLHNMRVSLNALKAVIETTDAIAKAENDKAVCVIRMGEDPRENDLEVHYEDREKSRAHTATVTVEDFRALIEQLMGKGD